MRNLIIYFILLNILFSCNSIKNIGFKGIYEKHGPDYIYSLKLNSDNNTFLLSKKYYEVNSSCQGSWEIREDTITLKCFKEELPAQITSGYMSKRKFEVLVLNRKKLKLNGVILQKK